MIVRFLLNGEAREVEAPPTRTLLDWLREDAHLPGTKEGCNEGDCGACTVMITDEGGPRALNACILFLPQLDGKSITTVEGLAAPDGTLHPVQQTMIDHHGAQCGFCTPGFVVAMATAHAKGRRDHETALAGNLCRCTGYAPILRAARAAESAPVPDHLWASNIPGGAPTATGEEPPDPAAACVAPETADALADWYAANPDATLIAGATDVGLWVTKDMRDLGPIAFLNRCADLRRVETGPDGWRVGAMTTMSDLHDLVADDLPSFAAMIRRYGSDQVRNAATLGGNIANGSPIGDNPPALIALGATLHLRRGDARRSLPLEDFFLDYGKQDRAPGEFVEAVTIPRQAPDFRVYKLSKRLDQDISAVCGGFNVTCADGVVTAARIAFGGMAATPRRAPKCEAALVGQPWTDATVRAAMAALEADFAPISDMRASAAYRAEAACNMALRYLHDLQGDPTDLTGVAS